MSHGPFYNPPVPFSTHLHNGIHDGTLIVVSGAVLHSGDRFAINFKCGDDNIALHFNPRFDGAYIVCNTLEHKKWGKEEHKREMPFHKGQPFEIRILATNHAYKVSVNRNHLLEYHHRIPLHKVNTIEISGCISLTSVEIQGQGGGFPHEPFPGGQMQNPAYPPGYSHGFPPGAGCNPAQFNPGQFSSANYAIPYKTNIYGGLFPSKVIVIRGAVGAHHPKRFDVNLKFCGGTAFHFNPRFDECTIVRNSYLNNQWGSEERQLPSSGMCFAPGQSFVIEIVCEHHHFRVNVNGNHVCNYNHRVPHLQQIDTLEINGDVVLQHVQIHCVLEWARMYSSIFHACACQGLLRSSECASYESLAMKCFQATATNQLHRPVPFSTHLQSGIHDGTLIVVCGAVLQSGDRWDMNFKCGPGEKDDIALHFNPRSDGEYVVCNTFEHELWGEELKKQEMPFHRGQPFEIRILVTDHEYKVSVNRNHFLEYPHRIPLHRVNTLEINGCISLTSVEIQGQGPAYPPQPGYSPLFAPDAEYYTIPYQTKIDGGLFPSKVIVIRGAVSANNPKRFHVNLSFGKEIAFHFNPRFNEDTIVRNSHLNNQWGCEERQLPSSGMCFAPGQSFVIEIVCEHHHFRVNVNGNHVCNYNHRVPHLQQIDTLEITGDVVLQHVQI
ncbi:galectin-9C-like [Hyla sarda]|uniref:galectin-9C-like n=1 Tax=Hyla sarda TaxID=327740 RepID=UPI0024C21446|nr:galectin-9C-like [Hyla sarda]